MDDKKKNHLKHLLFNDAWHLFSCGMNHNAMDRSCVYDRWLIEASSYDHYATWAEQKTNQLKSISNSVEEYVNSVVTDDLLESLEKKLQDTVLIEKLNKDYVDKFVDLDDDHCSRFEIIRESMAGKETYGWFAIMGDISPALENPRKYKSFLLEIMAYEGRLGLNPEAATSGELPHSKSPEKMLQFMAAQALLEMASHGD